MSKATSTQTTRRQLVKLLPIGAAGMLAPVAAFAAPAAASPLPRAEPTAYGRQLLRMIAAHTRLVAKVNDTATPDDEWATWAGRSHRAYCDIEAFGREICARAVASLSDLIDRAILAAWMCEADDHGRLHPIEIVEDEDRFQATLIESVLALAGIAPANCNSALAV